MPPVVAPPIPPSPNQRVAAPASAQRVVPSAIPTSPSKLASRIVQVQAGEPMLPDLTNNDELKQYQILLEPPSPEALFGRLDSEKMLEARMRQQGKQLAPPNAVQFPDRPPLAKTEFEGRTFPPQVMIAEPRFVAHHRLYFEEKNAERYGWDLGIAQPLVSSLYFYRDLVFLPHNVFSHPLRRYEASAGYCLPGDPVPYIAYPPEFTLVGGIAEGALAVGLFAVIP